LQERLALETTQQEYSDLPFRFAEVSKVLLDVLVCNHIAFFSAYLLFNSSASDDLDNPDKIRLLLQDLREARQAKSRDGLQKLDHSELSVSVTLFPCDPCSICSHLQLPNLCSMEINEIRPFFVRAMNILTQLSHQLPPGMHSYRVVFQLFVSDFATWSSSRPSIRVIHVHHFVTRL
jgi:GINS complex subunit 2